MEGQVIYTVHSIRLGMTLLSSPPDQLPGAEKNARTSNRQHQFFAAYGTGMFKGGEHM